ncbi:hypothetical protein Ade02nite_88470 [Paractinoplanes deccanensis]|uniref:4'-phosphopantetheinyl transferase n=1 Tax=Paractinoplanes deccanensis TaxID=113561 RepID=A0ABQ3YJM4_9ACTN|nr:4'-phosphopantetheinyl transferase superfamily protein [Actinoplanes deccanensis]GID80206.1 hypothetical protein Ade02nite_88470 [Actinoplanes deccanensis]
MSGAAVAVVTVARPAGAERVDRLAATLPPHERQRAARYDGHRRAEFVAGRVLARRLLAAELGCAPADVPLTVAPAGRPGVAGDPVTFSVAHAAGLVAVAVSADGAVGIDLESADRPPAAVAWSCSPDERRWLAALPRADRRAGFMRLWTRKEACVKATGAGINRRLADVHCGTGTAGIWRDVSWREAGLAPGYVAAVALRPAAPAIRIHSDRSIL